MVPVAQPCHHPLSPRPAAAAPRPGVPYTRLCAAVSELQQTLPSARGGEDGAAKETGMRCVSLPSAALPLPRFRKDNILPQSKGMVSSRLPPHRASTRERWVQPHPLRTLLYLTFSIFSTPLINISPSLTLSKCRNLSKSL